MIENSNEGNQSTMQGLEWEADISVIELDKSCRLPVLFMFWKAAGWLFLGSLLAFLNSLRFHAPDLLAHCPWLSFGRIAPAADTAFVYGFAIQAALAAALWMILRLTKTPLAESGFVFVGAGFWNLAVLIGFVGILAGDATSHPFFQLPQYALPLLFISYSIIAGLTLTTFLQRRVRDLYVSQWFLFAALLCFPWLLTTASLLLQYFPVRGVAQVVIESWYATGLLTTVLGGIALAILFYLIPKLLQRPLHSRYLALFAFWILLFFGAHAGVLSGTTVPSWISGLSTAMGFFVCFASLLIGINFYKTFDGSFARLVDSEFRFVSIALFSFLLFALLNALNAYAPVTQITQFTMVLPALEHLAWRGFVMMSLFAAGYHLLSKMSHLQTDERMLQLHFWMSTIGIFITVTMLGWGGLLQGFAMNNAAIPFDEITRSALPFLRMETLGSLLLLVGSILFLINVGRMGWHICCCSKGALLSSLLRFAEIKKAS